MPNNTTISEGTESIDYKFEYKRLMDENRDLKTEMWRLRETIVEMCIYVFTSRFSK